MGELKTISVDAVHEELLLNISDSYQKTEGFPTWDILKAGAFGIKKVWDNALLVQYKQDIDNLTGDELEQVIYQRTGLKRRDAVKAKGTVTIIKGSGVLTTGDLFSSEDGVLFKPLQVVAVTDGSLVNVEAVEGGISGNVPPNSVVSMPITIPGISKITNEQAMTGGYDPETDEDFRARYYEYLQMPATCGNKYHYLMWAKEVDGVKGVKVIPCWNGKNTVKVIVMGNDYKPASESLVKAVQDYIDPGCTGEGLGQAPIGAVTTVVAADELTINVSVTLTLGLSVDKETVQELVYEAIDDYIKSIAFTGAFVSYAKIGACIMGVDGVIDYADLLVNEGQANIEISFNQCPVLGEVVFNDV